MHNNNNSLITFVLPSGSNTLTQEMYSCIACSASMSPSCFQACLQLHDQNYHPNPHQHHYRHLHLLHISTHFHLCQMLKRLLHF